MTFTRLKVLEVLAFVACVSLSICVAGLTGCAGSTTKPAVSPTQFCADAKVADTLARSLTLSAKGAADLTKAESVLWPSPTTGCNASPLPASWDASILVPMATAAANIVIAQNEK